MENKEPKKRGRKAKADKIIPVVFYIRKSQSYIYNRGKIEELIATDMNVPISAVQTVVAPVRPIVAQDQTKAEKLAMLRGVIDGAAPQLAQPQTAVTGAVVVDGVAAGIEEITRAVKKLREIEKYSEKRQEVIATAIHAANKHGDGVVLGWLQQSLSGEF